MSLKSRFFTIFTIAGATIAFSTIGMAQDKPTTATPTEKVERPQKRMGGGMGPGQFGRGQFGPRRGGPGMHRGMNFRGLNLTDAQKLQIQSIMAANKPSQEGREEIRSLQMAKRAGLLTTAQQERLTAIQAARQEKGRGVHEQILGILTPEQKAQIDQRKKQMQDRIQQRKQMRDPNAPVTTKPKGNMEM
jgi:Spy/CpxP family protein refolding chaperone